MNAKYLLLTLVVVFVLLANMLEPPEPAGTVGNKTVGNYSNLFFSYNIIRYPSSVEITPAESLNNSIVLGFATESWSINFGSVPAKGSYATRTVDISNSNEFDVEIIMKAYGNISDMVIFRENNIVLEPGEKKSVGIVLESKEDIGNYSGEIDIMIKKPIYIFPSIV